MISEQRHARHFSQYLVGRIILTQCTVRNLHTQQCLSNCSSPRVVPSQNASQRNATCNAMRKFLQSKSTTKASLLLKQVCYCSKSAKAIHYQTKPSALPPIRSRPRSHLPSRTASGSLSNLPSCATLLPQPRRDRDYRLVDWGLFVQASSRRRGIS